MTNFLTQVDGFTPIIDVVVEDVGLVGAAIYGVVWRHCQMKDGVCYASREALAQKAGVSLATVNRYLGELCERGYLEDTTPDLRNKPHTYRDTGKVMILGAVEARRADDAISQSDTAPEPPLCQSEQSLCQGDIPAISQCNSHYITVPYEETIRDNQERMKITGDDGFSEPADNGFGAVYALWEQSAGLLSKTNADLLADMCGEYGAPMVQEALLETVKQIQRPKIKYMEAVLQNWRGRGQDKRAAPKDKSLQQIAPGVWRA